MKKFFLCLFIFYSLFSSAQNPLVKMWDKRFGGALVDQLNSVQQTADGGYILGGNSKSSIGGDKTQSNWDASLSTYDYWIVKTDSLGNKLWDKNFGGTDDDVLHVIQQTNDGGFILGGISLSGISGDKTQPCWGIAGDNDYWIVKIDSLGNKQWDKDFGGSGYDRLYSIQQTFDGGFILGGHSYSGIGGDKTQPSWGDYDYWIIKTDSIGNKQWDKDFGGIDIDELYSIQQTNDGGFILGGISNSDISGDKTQANWDTSLSSYDYWIIKTDSIGNKQWDKDFGGMYFDYLNSIQQTTDGGFILGGRSSSSIGGNKTQATWGAEDYWMVKTDSLGNKQWDKDFGGTNVDQFQNITQTRDSGYIIAGNSISPIGGNKTENNLGYSQTWVVKIDSVGNLLWDKTIFTLGNDYQGLAMQTKEGCYLIANYTSGGIGGYKTQLSNGLTDYWIIKFYDSTLTTNIANAEKENQQLLLSPNPTNSEFTIQNAELKIDRIEIFNLLGEKIYSLAANCAPCIVNCEFLPPGIYFVKAIAGEKVLVGKVVKQ